MALDVHQAVTDKIIATLEAGEAGQWTCPWHRTGGGLPRNSLTVKAYSGINTLSLWVGAQAAGFADDRWATYKQWAELGAQVRKGERSTLVVFFKEMDPELGLEAEPHPTHSSYIASWIKLLKSDPRAIFTAASAASRAAGFLTSLQVAMAEAA